jgi:hypothetical protein
MLKTILLVLLLLLLPPPIAAEPGDPYEQAADALKQLRDDNERLRREVRMLREQSQIRELRALTNQAVFVRVPDDRLDNRSHERRHVWQSNGVERPGFNAAFVYDEPGRFDITLDGRPFATVVVNRRSSLVTLRLPAGEVRYDQLPRPLPRGTLLVGHPDGTVITGPSNKTLVEAWQGDVTIRDVTFRHDNLDHKDGMAVMVGPGTAILDCRIDRIANLVVFNGDDGRDLLVQGVEQLHPHGLRRYGLGLFGVFDGVAVYDSLFLNSNDEHILRFSGDGSHRGTRFVAVHNNELANLSRDNGGPAWDMGKSAVILQVGEYASIDDNKLVGANGVGPLPKGPESIASKEARYRFARFAGNEITGKLELDHGAEHVRIVGGSMLNDEQAAINAHGGSERHGRSLVDVVIEDTTIIGRGGGGPLVRIWPGGDVTLRDVVLRHANLREGDRTMPPLWLGTRDAATLEDVRVSLSTAWPRPALVLVGDQNSTDNYLEPGDISGLDALEEK